MDRSRLPFLHSPHGHHHQRALLYHPRPRLTMPPSLPIYDSLLSPPMRHSMPPAAMNFPRSYLDEYPPPFLNGLNPGSYGLMGHPSGGSYPMPMDFGYGFPGGLPPYPIAPFPPHSAYMPMRKPPDDAALHSQYQTHMEALQDHVNSFLRLTSPPDPGKPTQKPGNELPDWSGVEGPFLGRGSSSSNGRTAREVLSPRLPTLPKLRQAVDGFASPPRRGSLFGWHSTLTPPPLHLPTVKQSNLGHPPALHTIRERSESAGKKRKSTGELEATTQNGVLTECRPEDLNSFLAKMPKLPPLVIGNKDLAKKLTAERIADGVLNLSCSSEKSAVGVKRRPMSHSPVRDRKRPTVDRGAWQPADARNQSFAKNQSPIDGSLRGALLRDGGVAKDLGTAEHPNQRGDHPQDLSKSPGGRVQSHFPPPPPYISSCLTDVEAMRNAYTGTHSSFVGCTENESSPQFSPTALPPPPPLGFRGRGCFGAKRRRMVSPPEAQPSSVFSPPPVASFPPEYARLWDWSGENISVDCEPPGDGFASDVESRLGSVVHRPGHIAVPSNIREEEEATVAEPGLIRVKDEPIDFDPNDRYPYPREDDGLGSRNEIVSFGGDEGRSTTLTTDPGGVDQLGECDRDWVDRQGESNVDGSFLNVPFVESTGGVVLSPEFQQPLGVEKRTGEAGGEDGTGEFRCHLCNYNGRSQHCLNKHFRAHGQACKICRYCLKAFERPSDLVRHEERHQKRNHALATPYEHRPAQPSRFAAPGKRVRRRHAWSCRQCHFTCREARKLIQHTRRAHPIFVDCPLCRLKFVSEAELAVHKATRHPVAVGRLDSYSRGVLTATRLVTCEVVGEQEISVDLAELSELPVDCSEIPVVSNVRDMQCILEKDTSDPGRVNCSNSVSQVGDLSPIKPYGNRSVPRFFPPPVGRYLSPKAKSLKNPPNSINIRSPTVAGCVDVAPDLTMTPISLIPKRHDTVVDLCNRPTIPHHSKNTQQDKPRFSPKHTPRSVDVTMKILEKSPLELLKDAQLVREALAGPSPNIPPPTNPSALSNSSHLETPPKSSSASHPKPSLLTNLLAKPRPAEPVSQSAPENRQLSETCEKEVGETVCALEDVKAVSTEVDSEWTNAAESGPGTTEKSTSEIVAAPKKEPVTSKNDRNSEILRKTDVLSSGEAPGTTASSRKVFAECNGAEKTRPPEMYVCVRCKYSTNAKFKYQQHLKAHDGRFICKRCNKACIKSSDLYRHWVTHNVKGPDGYFACDSCDFTSPQKYVVEDHMKRHYTLHPEPAQRLLSAMSRCGLCQKNVLRARLFEHKRVVHGKFFQKPRLNAEPAGSMETDANGNSVKAALKVFACPQCDRKFTTPSYLLRHHFIHHQPPAVADGPAKIEENACSCRFCGVKFEDVDHLQEHEINHILQTCTDREYIERCRKRKKRSSVDRKLSSPPLAVVPSAKSSKVTPHRRRLSCPRCKKPFKVQYFLDQHMRIHSGERPYVCQLCGAGFALFQRLNVHRRFKCPHRKTLPSTERPSLNSPINSPGDALDDPSSGSNCGQPTLNGSDSIVEKKHCISSPLVPLEHAVEVSG